ncbi:GNAT family N-acetyltransferase [Nanoarchaeota archaeon]
MSITLKSTKDLPIPLLDELFDSVNWLPRKQKWDRILQISRYICTAWHDDKLIGMGRILEDGEMAVIYDFCVRPEHRRKGIGTQILDHLLNQIKDKGYYSISLFPWEHDPKLIPFYEKFGFKQIPGMELKKDHN